MPLLIESGFLAGIRQDYFLFLAAIGSIHFVLIAVGTTFSNRGERAGRRFFLSLAVAGLCAALLLALELVAFVWAVDSVLLVRSMDLLRMGTAGALLSGGCALSPRFSWFCAGAAGVVFVIITAGLVLFFGSRGITIGTGIAVFFSALGLVIHIIRFQGPDRSARRARLLLCLVAGSFCLLGADAWVRHQATWWIVEPWLIVPAVAPWTAGLALWIFNDGVRSIANFREIKNTDRLFSLWFFPVLQALIFSIGSFGTDFSGRQATVHAVEHLHLQVRASSAWLNPDLFASQIEEGIGHDPGAAARLWESLESIRLSDPEIEGGVLWRIRENRRIPVVESHGEGHSPYKLDPIPSAMELRGILNQQPVAVGVDDAERGPVFLASAPIYTSYPDRVAGWLSLIINPDAFVARVSASRTSSLVVVGLLSLLGTGIFAFYVRGQIDADLRIAMERAEVADQAKSEFLAIMSHEIRTPLQSVLGYADLVIDTPLDETQRHQIESIRAQGQTLMRIVQDILDFSAMRRGGFSLQNKPIRLRELIEEVAGAVSPMADRKGLRFDFSLADDLPPQVVADGVRLRQVLHNLIGNAIKYTPRGRVLFEVRVDPIDPPDSAEGPAVVVFRVADTGNGIPKHARDRLFEPFYRVGLHEAPDESGAGLGLAIVNRLCELMGAKITVESEIGEGTTVEVRAPFELTTEALAEVDPILPDQGDGVEGAPPVLAWELPMTILLVEDNGFIRNLFLEFLRKLGYHPDVVENGRDAVAACLQTEYDLILMDLKMPELDGPDATREIREMLHGQERPWIIGLSASTRDEDINEAMNAGMNDFLAKPVDLKGLLETILFSPLAENMQLDRSAYGGVDGSDEAGETLIDVIGAPNRERAFALFVEETPQILDAMREAYASADLLKVRNRAHYLKNSGLYLREAALVDLCETICTDATEARHREVGVGLDTLEELVVAIIASEAIGAS
jgi:signal transduction histidine kinase/DNA-binding NarL/FixJ family response regulator